MRSRIAVLLALCLLAGVARPALAGPPAPDSATAADTSSTTTVEGHLRATQSLTEATPSSRSLDLLRTRVGRRVVRVSAGHDDYEFSRARFERSGVVFSTAGSEGLPRWAAEGEAQASSPIAWDRIDRIQAWKPCGLRGALIGGLVGAAAYTVILSQARADGDEVGFGAILLLPLVPLAAVLGSAVGAFQQRLEPVWQREFDRSAPAPGAHR